MFDHWYYIPKSMSPEGPYDGGFREWMTDLHELCVVARVDHDAVHPLGVTQLRPSQEDLVRTQRNRAADGEKKGDRKRMKRESVCDREKEDERA